MGDGSMTTLTIADPTKSGITQYLKSLPSRNPEKVCVRNYIKQLCGPALAMKLKFTVETFMTMKMIFSFSG